LLTASYRFRALLTGHDASIARPAAHAARAKTGERYEAFVAALVLFQQF